MTEKRFREDTGQIIDQNENKVLTITQAKNKMNQMNERNIQISLEENRKRCFITEKGLLDEYLEWREDFDDSKKRLRG